MKKLSVRERSEIIITTGDLSRPYRVIRPLFAYVTDANGMLIEAAKKFGIDLASDGLTHQFLTAMAGTTNVFHQRLPATFQVCVELLRLQAVTYHADAVVWMRFDMDVTGLFDNKTMLAQAYGTAVLFEPESDAAGHLTNSG